MKKVILFFAILLSIITVNAQTSQNYNSLYDRTEFLDSYGNMIDYAKYNSLYDRIEYFDRNRNMIKYENKNSLYD